MPEASLTLPDDFIKIASSKSDSTVLAKAVFSIWPLSKAFNLIPVSKIIGAIRALYGI
jgi:hypothetical protein